MRGQWQLLLGQVLYDIEGQAGFRILQKKAHTQEVHRSISRAKRLVGLESPRGGFRAVAILKRDAPGVRHHRREGQKRR